MIRHLLKLMWNRKRSNGLIIAEIFVSFLVVFVVVTGLIYLASIYRKPLGFEYENIWNISLEAKLQTDDVWTPEMVNRFRNILREVSAMPEVESAAGVHTSPYDFSNSEGRWEVNGRTLSFGWMEVTDDYDKTMGMRLLAGRWFGPQDEGSSWQPVVINRNAAQALFGNENPLGKPLTRESETEQRVVGVIDDFRKSGEFSPPKNWIFQRVRIGDETSRPPGNIAIRLRPGTPAAFEESLVRRIESLAPGWSIKVQPMTQMRQFTMRLALAPIIVGVTVAGFLILMVALGLSGVMWQNVTQRTREIGLRRALGGTGTAVSRQILLEITIIVSIAAALGTAVVIQLPIMGLTGWLGPGIFASGLSVALLLIYAVAISCALYPGWMASRIQPSEALRYE